VPRQRAAVFCCRFFETVAQEGSLWGDGAPALASRPRLSEINVIALPARNL
jgi:hypothetical protein